MLRLRLKSSGQVLAAIPRFNRFQEPYNLKIINQKEDIRQGAVELRASSCPGKGEAWKLTPLPTLLDAKGSFLFF